jgi:alkyl hydroperoxide reductase subunit AhpC
MTVRCGDLAPDFTAETTHGVINFHAWKGDSWTVFFASPRNIAPACTTELGTPAPLQAEFDKRNTKLIALSTDRLNPYQRWSGNILDITGYAINFPIIADPDRRIAALYDMLHPNASDTTARRSFLIIGPDHKVKLTLSYPACTGRSCQGVLRVLDSLQLMANYAVATPAGWRDGEPVSVLASLSDADAMTRFPRGFPAKMPFLRAAPQPNRERV